MIQDSDLVAEFLKAQRREERLAERKLVEDFVQAAQNDDGAAAWRCIEALDYNPLCWKPVMRAIATTPRVPAKFRRRFLQLFLQSGDHMRQEVGDDLIWTDALRVLLPPYKGSAVRLYRGEGFYNRRHRNYGVSWTSNEQVARSYAVSGVYRTSKGGSVVLTTLASPDAIICAPLKHDNRFAEDEYVVDRRRLRHVHVLDRFSQLSHEEWRTSRTAA